MKKTILWTILALLLPVTQAWGNSTTYYAALKASVSSSGGGTVYAGTSKTAGTYAASSTSEAQTSTTENEEMTFYAFAQANEGFEFAGWAASDGGTVSSTANPYEVTVKCSSSDSSKPTTTTVWANFSKKVLAAFGITFETSDAGTYTADGAAPANKTGLTEATSVTLASSDPNFLNWKVNGAVVSDNPYTATCLADTTISAEFLTADMVAEATTLADLTAALANDGKKKVLVPAGTEIVMDSGTVSVPAGKQLVVDGALWMEGGSLTSGGKVIVNGTLSKCTQIIRQNGDNGVPYNPYSGDEKYQVKYWKTTSSTPTVTVSGATASSHVVIVNGLGETVYRGAAANAFVCTTDKSVAINHITGIKASYSSGTDAYNAVAKNKHNVSQTDCSLMSGAASELVLLTAKGTVNVGSSNPLNSGFIADCAGNTISFTSKQFANAANVVVLNASTVTSSKLTNARLTAINCSTVTGAGSDGINNNQASYYTSLHLYDCSSFSKFTFSASAIMTVGTPGVCFFSGGPYGPTFTGNYHVYGGKFSKDPTNYLASGDLEAPKEGSYWVVRVKVPTVNVVKIGTTEYESLQEAINAAASGATLELLPGIAAAELAAPVTVAVGKTVTLDLAGYAVMAPNGAIVNHGTLHLQDSSTFDVPGSLTTVNGNVIVNDGTLDITYGAYSGSIALNGGTLTTHFGTFDGTFTVADGLDPKTVTNLRGGEFSASVSAFLQDGYSEVRYRVKSEDPIRYWVVQPQGIIASTTYSGADKAWKLDFLSSTDLAIFKKERSRGAHASLSDWQRRAELYSSVQPYSNYVIDCALIFDRAVAAESVTFYGKTQIGMSQALDRDLAGNEDYPVLAHRIYEMGSTPLTYGRMIDEVGSITAGVKNNDSANNGTVCTVDVRFSSQSAHVVGEYDKFMALKDVRYMLGGKKAAIDRSTSRVAYDSLTAAVADAQDGETILVGADTAENVTFAKAGTFTIDPYGFNFTGTVSAGAGFTIQSTTTQPSSVVALQDVPSADAVVYVVVMPSVAQIGDAGYATLADAVAAAAKGDTIVLLADSAAGVALSTGVSLDTNGKAYTGTVTAATEGDEVVFDGTSVYIAEPVPQAYVTDNPTAAEAQGLDAAYTFAVFSPADLAIYEKVVAGTELTAAEQARYDELYAQFKPFFNWHADFVVTFDKPVKAGSVELAGQYGTGNKWYSGSWLSFPLPKDLAAGEPLRLLKDGLEGFAIYESFEQILTEVVRFQCGVRNVSADNVGTKMTVELRLYEPDYTGNPTTDETERAVSAATAGEDLSITVGAIFPAGVRITSFSKDGDTVTLTWEKGETESYQVLATDSLEVPAGSSKPNWQPVGDPVKGVTVTLPNQTAAKRFYRVETVPQPVK